MRQFIFLASLAAASAANLAAYEVKESHFVPRIWSRAGLAPKNHVMTLHIALRQDRFEELEQQLWDISDPDHSKYGQHLSSEQVEELVKPSPEALDSVLKWLSENNIAFDQLSLSDAADSIKVDLSIERIERLLRTTYHHYVHEDGESLLRAPEWSLPRYLHQYIDTIQPTNIFTRPNLRARSTHSHEILEFDKRAVTPVDFHASAPGYPDISTACRNLSWTGTDCLSTLYGTKGYKLQAGGRNRIGITNWSGQTQARADLRNYLKQYRPDAVHGADNFTNVLIANGPPSLEKFTKEQIKAGLGAEGNLDADLIIGLTYPTPLTIYSTGGEPPFIPDAFSSTNTNEPFLTWLEYVLSHSDSELPYVVSISAADDEQSVPYSYAKKVCNLFAQLAARGVSTFVASGDSGVGESGTCESNDGKKRKMFVPAFPASCPYVTTVGGTQFGAFGPAPNYTYIKGSVPEVAWFSPYEGIQGTGGGFSNYFAHPSYQQSAVQKYRKSLNGIWDEYYNHTGRAYPDISALASGVVQTWNGYTYQSGGTSAAAPIVASVFALLNDARLAAGQQPLGLLNPLIYKLSGRGFHDITNGTNIGCTELNKKAGFPSKKGWDAATGFGSPDFKALKELIVKPVGYGGYGV